MHLKLDTTHMIDNFHRKLNTVSSLYHICPPPLYLNENSQVAYIIC